MMMAQGTRGGGGWRLAKVSLHTLGAMMDVRSEKLQSQMTFIAIRTFILNTQGRINYQHYTISRCVLFDIWMSKE